MTNNTDRIAVVDVLRAFALFGIIITHSAMGFLAGPEPSPAFMKLSALDRTVDELNTLLTIGKFFAIFSFLFGLSFAIQLENAARKNAPFAGRFAWRLALLLLIGYVHTLFFSGDILMIYALLGLLLIPFRRLKTRTLTIIALVCVLNIPGLALGTLIINAPAPSAEQQQQRATFAREFAERAQREYLIKKNGTVAEIAQVNNSSGAYFNKAIYQLITGRLWMTFGLFLLGLCAGRLALFRDSAPNRTFFKRLMVGAGVTAALGTAAVVLRPSTFNIATFADVLANFASSLQQMSLAAFYVAALTLLYWRRPAGWLSALAPMGKMGLTTYLMQSLFGVLVFLGPGLGLMGDVGVATAVGFGILFFIAQIFFARWWMSRFSLGPVEWLWRSLTYFKLQPLARPGLSTA